MVSRDYWIHISTKLSPFSLIPHHAEISRTTMQPSFLSSQFQSVSSTLTSKGFNLFVCLLEFLEFLHVQRQHDIQTHILSRVLSSWTDPQVLGAPVVQQTRQANN